MIEFHLESYSQARDYGLLCAWWEAHGEPLEAPEWLPRIGFIVAKQEEPLAACFLGIVEGTRICELMHLTSNPAAPRALVGRALHAAAAECLAVAGERGMVGVRMFTTHRSVVRSAWRRHGFVLVAPNRIARPQEQLYFMGGKV